MINVRVSPYCPLFDSAQYSRINAFASFAGANRRAPAALRSQAAKAHRASSTSVGRKPVLPVPSAMKYVTGELALPARVCSRDGRAAIQLKPDPTRAIAVNATVA